jgi:hypothetical protein
LNNGAWVSLALAIGLAGLVTVLSVQPTPAETCRAQGAALGVPVFTSDTGQCMVVWGGRVMTMESLQRLLTERYVRG